MKIASAPTAAPPLRRSLVFLFAAGAAISVANLYYNQPLLVLIGRDLRLSAGATGVIPTSTQIGYAAGLLLFTPLGDVLPRRGLIVTLCVASAVALIGLGLSQTLWQVTLFSFLTGIFSVTPQILLPLAADLADDENRGQAIGLVMSGLLLGVLAARVVSGGLAVWIGWRGIFSVAAILMICLALLLRSTLPALPKKSSLHYAGVLLSLWTLFREQRQLRQTSAIGALLFGAFSVLWTVLAYRLHSAPYDFGSGVVGLFGLAGIAGVLGAPLTGKISDRRGPFFMVGVGIAATLAAFIAFWLGSDELFILIGGVIVLDYGVQTGQVSNQARIYSLVPSARSRVNSVFMVFYFLGGAVGSALGSQSYDRFGWTGSCVVAILMIVGAGMIHVAGRPRTAIHA